MGVDAGRGGGRYSSSNGRYRSHSPGRCHVEWRAPEQNLPPRKKPPPPLIPLLRSCPYIATRLPYRTPSTHATSPADGGCDARSTRLPLRAGIEHPQPTHSANHACPGHARRTRTPLAATDAPSTVTRVRASAAYRTRGQSEHRSPSHRNWSTLRDRGSSIHRRGAHPA